MKQPFYRPALFVVVVACFFFCSHDTGVDTTKGNKEKVVIDWESGLLVSAC